MDLYPKILGKTWNQLPASIQSAHSVGDEKRGLFRVTHGGNPVTRLLARLSGLPPQADSTPVLLKIIRTEENEGERWERRFGGSGGFTTFQWAAGGELVERFDCWELHFALRVVGQTLVYEPCGARLCLGPLRIPAPRTFAPCVEATEESDGPHRVHVRVRVTLPLVGLLIAYDGHLEVGGIAS